MWPFKRKPVAVEPADNTDLYHVVYERKAMPDPGAMAYALETLALAPFSPIGPSVRVRQTFRSTAQQLYSNQAVHTSGMGTVAGQIFGQPLFDPNAVQGGGFVRGVPEMISPLAAFNIPATVAAAIGPNTVDISKMNRGL